MAVARRLRSIRNSLFSSSDGKRRSLYGQRIALITIGICILTLSLTEVAAKKIDEWYSIQGRVIKSSSVSRFSFDSADQIIDSRKIVSEFYREYFTPKDETPAISAIRNRFNTILVGTSFTDIDSLLNYLDFIGAAQTTVDVSELIIRNRMLSSSFLCSDLSNCSSTALPINLNRSQLKRSIDLIINRVFPIILSQPLYFEDARLALAANTQNLIDAMYVLDVPYDYEQAIQTDLSRAQVALAFLNGRGEHVDSDFLDDLSNFIRSDSLQYEESSDRYFGIYVESLNHYSRGCFRDAIRAVSRLRTLTNNPYINDLVDLLVVRAATRPLMVESFWKANEKQADVISLEFCDEEISVENWISEFEQVISIPNSPRGFSTFADDFLFLESIFIEWREKLALKDDVESVLDSSAQKESTWFSRSGSITGNLEGGIEIGGNNISNSIDPIPSMSSQFSVRSGASKEIMSRIAKEKVSVVSEVHECLPAALLVGDAIANNTTFELSVDDDGIFLKDSLRVSPPLDLYDTDILAGLISQCFRERDVVFSARQNFWKNVIFIHLDNVFFLDLTRDKLLQ